MLTEAIERHIALHLATGYKLRSQGFLLRSFARYAHERGDQFVRVETVVNWASLGRAPVTCRGRLHTVQRFARLMTAEDPRHEIPPGDVFGQRPPRPTPFIFTDDNVKDLLAVADKLGPKGSIRPKTIVALLGLVAATGLRISEALRLEMKDITDDGLMIRETKFRKTRLVPIHETTREALEQYDLHRARVAAADPRVFVLDAGTGIHYKTIARLYLRLIRQMGIDRGPGKRRPRIHDLRHTFAVRSLEACSGNRADVHRHMHALSTYMGHTRLCDTYWYLQATPRLLSELAAQCEAFVFPSAHGGVQ